MLTFQLKNLLNRFSNALAQFARQLSMIILKACPKANNLTWLSSFVKKCLLIAIAK